MRLGMRGAVAALLLGVAAGEAAARDNFLVLVADDLGVDEVGVYSRDDLYGHPGEGASPGPTPVIDGLAADGVLFRNAWATPSCSPSRAALLTGRYGFRTGVGEPGVYLDLGEALLPELLAATHADAALGKWHLGLDDADHPNDAGFTYYAGAIRGSLPSYESWPKVTNGSTQPGFTVYATTDNVDEAVAAIAGFGEDPWLVWVSFNAPHTPFHAPPASLHGQTLSGDPDDTPVDHYEAAVEAMDSEIGRLLASIPAGVLADTTIVFLGDNGTPSQAVEAPFIASRAKGSVYEGGVNVPLVVSSPHVPAAQRGAESLALVHVLDLFATFAEIAGVPAGDVDALSLLPHLQDPTQGTSASRPYVYTELFSPNGPGPYSDEQRAIRDDRYKLIWRNGTWEEMYDLDVDPFEQDDLLAGALDPEEQAAYDGLVAAVEGLHAAPALPALGGPARLLVAAVLAMLALLPRRRLRAC